MTSTRVLLVDDDPVVLDAIGMELQGAGYEVQTALGRQAALQLLSDLSRPIPHVIITDARMPKPGIRSNATAGRDVRCHAFVPTDRLRFELVDTLVRLETKGETEEPRHSDAMIA